MVDRVLLPLESGEPVDRVSRKLGPLMAHRTLDVVLLGVVPEDDTEIAGNHRIDVAAQAKRLDEAAASLMEAGITASSRIGLGLPHLEIARHAVTEQVSLIAMETHGRRGVSKWLRPSVTESVLRIAPCPLFLTRMNETDVAPSVPVTKILVPLDGSSWSGAILALVASYANSLRAEVVLFYDHAGLSQLEETTPVMDPDSMLERHADALRNRGIHVSCHVTTVGRPAHQIVEIAQQNSVQLVMMTTHGRSGWDRRIFGSVTEGVLRHCPVPIVVQRGGHAEAFRFDSPVGVEAKKRRGR